MNVFKLLLTLCLLKKSSGAQIPYEVVVLPVVNEEPVDYPKVIADHYVKPIVHMGLKSMDTFVPAYAPFVHGGIRAIGSLLFPSTKIENADDLIDNIVPYMSGLFGGGRGSKAYIELFSQFGRLSQIRSPPNRVQWTSF